MLHQTVEAVFPFRALPAKPKPKPTLAPVVASEVKKAPAWDSAAQAAQQAAAAEAAAKAAAAVDLGGHGERPVSPLPHPMTVAPEDLLFFSPGDRIVVLQQFRGSPWWLGAVKLCSQEQAHSKLRALERLNAAATHSEIASSPILAKASTALRARGKSINNGQQGVGGGGEAGGAGAAVGGSPALAGMGATVLSDGEDGDNSGSPSSPTGDAARLKRRSSSMTGASGAGAGGGNDGGSPKLGAGPLTNDSITAKLVRHASRRSVMNQLDQAQKEVTLQNSFAGMKMAFGQEVAEEEDGKTPTITSPPMSYDASGKPPRAGGGALFSIDAPMEKSIMDHGSGNGGDEGLMSNGSFSFRPGGGGGGGGGLGNASFAGGMVSNSSFFINRDLGNAMDKALQDIPGNYNAGKSYDVAIDGELFNFKSQVATMTSPSDAAAAAAGSPTGTLARKGSTLMANGSFSGIPPLGNHSFTSMGNLHLNGSSTDGPHHHHGHQGHIGGSPALGASGGANNSSSTFNPKTIFRLDAYKIGLFYVPFTRNLDDIAKLTTTATEDGRKAKDSLLKDVNQSEKGGSAKPNAGDGGIVSSSKDGGGKSAATAAADAKTFSVPMEMKTSALRHMKEKERGASGVKYHNVAGKVGGGGGESEGISSSASGDPSSKGGGGGGMYYQSKNAPSAGRGKQQHMSDEDDRRLRKLLGLEADDDEEEDSAKKKASSDNNNTHHHSSDAADARRDGFDFEGKDFRKALLEMQATSDNSHTQEQLDAARIRLLRTVIKSGDSSFDRATTSVVNLGGARGDGDMNAMGSGGGLHSAFGGGANTNDAIHDQINIVHRQLLDKAIELRTNAKRLNRDAATLRIREDTLADRLKIEAKSIRGGSMRRANIVTSLLPDKDDGDDFDLSSSGVLGSNNNRTGSFSFGRGGGGSGNNSFFGKRVDSSDNRSPSPRHNNHHQQPQKILGANALESLQCEVEIMKAKLKLCTFRRDQTGIRVEVLNAYADGIEEDAPPFAAFSAVEKENTYAEELAAIIANGGKPPAPQMGSLTLAGSSMDLRNGGGGNASFAGSTTDDGAASGASPTMMDNREDRPPSPPTEAALIEEPKAKKLLKKILKRIEEAEATSEDYSKQKKKLERRIEKNGNILKEVAKAIATHKENQLKRKKLIKDALGEEAYVDPEDDDDDEAAVRDDLPAPELPPMGPAGAKKKSKNGIAAAEEESDPQLAKVPSDVRHTIKMLLFDPEGIPEHQQSVEMIEKCIAAVDKLASKVKKALKNSSANAEATAGLKAERDKLLKKVAKGDAATSELERTIKFTQQEIEGIQKQAVNAKATCEAAEKELASKKVLTAEAIKGWQAKKKEAGKDIDALKKKIDTETERVAKFEVELKALEEKRAAAEAAAV